jgi:hypothetical protein
MAYYGETEDKERNTELDNLRARLQHETERADAAEADVKILSAQVKVDAGVCQILSEYIDELKGEVIPLKDALAEAKQVLKEIKEGNDKYTQSHIKASAYLKKRGEAPELSTK